MLSFNPTSLFSGENGRRSAPFRVATIADANYTPHDLAGNVKTLPSQGMVLKEDGIMQVVLGQVVTAAELVALKFKPATAQTGSAIGSIIKPKLESWFVLSVPQNGEPRSIGIQASETSVYAYGSSSHFPANSFNSTSYGVDVVFKPQLAT